MHAHAQLADPIAAATLLSKSEVESLGSMGFVVRDNWLGEEPSNARVSSCTVRRVRSTCSPVSPIVAGSQDKAAEALRFVESLARQGRLTQGVVAGQGAWPAPLGKSLRGDAITWLTADDLTGPEGSVLRELMDSFEALRSVRRTCPGARHGTAVFGVRGRKTERPSQPRRLHLRRSAFLALHEEYDVQVARYATGTAYVRHADVKRVGSQRTRLITACWYPNVGWNAGADGGSLRLYPDGGQAPVDVAPVGDRLVVFQSSLEHEVLVTHAPRCAFTAWFMK